MSEHPLSVPIRVGLQPRESRFGHGENQRVWECTYKNMLIGINLGDIAAAPTTAIMCPTSPDLVLEAGAIENRIADVAGSKLFGEYTKDVMTFMMQIKTASEHDSLDAAAQLTKLLSGISKVDHKIPSESIRELVLAMTNEYGNRKAYKGVGVIYGGSIPAPSFDLMKHGIQFVALTNVRPMLDKGMTIHDMMTFTNNSASAVNSVGADSLTIPSVGTGMASMMGWGLSLEDSMGGFMRGAKEYTDNTQGKTSIRRLDYNIYTQPTSANAVSIGQKIDGMHLLDSLKK